MSRYSSMEARYILGVMAFSLYCIAICQSKSMLCAIQMINAAFMLNDLTVHDG